MALRHEVVVSSPRRTEEQTGSPGLRSRKTKRRTTALIHRETLKLIVALGVVEAAFEAEPLCRALLVGVAFRAGHVGARQGATPVGRAARGRARRRKEPIEEAMPAGERWNRVRGSAGGIKQTKIRLRQKARAIRRDRHRVIVNKDSSLRVGAHVDIAQLDRSPDERAASEDRIGNIEAVDLHS